VTYIEMVSCRVERKDIVMVEAFGSNVVSIYCVSLLSTSHVFILLDLITQKRNT
jgi:hypothetical protein